MTRLRRYSVSLMLLLASAVVSADASERTWTFQKNRDPLGSGFVAVAKSAAGSLQPLVRCWTETALLDVRFALGAAEPVPVTDRVLIAFDRQKASAAEWSRNATGLALVVPEPLQRTLLSQLRQANEMRLTLAVANGEQRTHVLALDGSARAIDQALASCG